MRPVRLKNYLKYLDKLETYAKAVGLTVEYKTELGDGVYIASRRKIRIDPDMSEVNDIATLLHELGHAMDDNLLDLDTPQYNLLADAYKAVYASSQNKKQLELVVKCEARAWDYGKTLAKTLKIPLGKWYDRIAKDAVDAYKKV